MNDASRIDLDGSLGFTQVMKKKKSISEAISVVINRIKDIIKVTLDELIQLQGSLKRLDEASYKKFSKQLLQNGFTSPFIIWIDSKKKKRILDGHQRLATLKMMKAEGVIVPDTYSAVVIDADSEKKAREILLGLASVYGKMTDESLSDFMIESELDLSFLNENIDLPFKSNLDVDGAGLTDMPELNTDDRTPFQQKAFHLHDSQVAIVDKAMDLAMKKYGANLTEDLTTNKNSNAITLICQMFIDAESDQ